MFAFTAKRLFANKKIDYYKVLGVESNAKRVDIRNAYLKLAKLYHPDTPTGNEEKFKRINEAWTVLGNDKTRLEYDTSSFSDQNGFWNMGKKDQDKGMNDFEK